MTQEALNIVIPKGSNAPLYVGLKEQLLGLLRARAVKPGEQFYSYRRIAEAGGVSRATAQLAIKELVREGWLKNLPRRGTVVSCLPGDEGSIRASWSVAVVLSKWDKNEAVSWNDGQILPAMLERGASRGVSFELVPHSMVTNGIEALDRRMEDCDLDGVIWLCMRSEAAVGAAQYAGRGLCQIAVQNRPINLSIPMVAEDNHAAAAEAVHILTQEGHERILIVHCDPQISTYRERLEGLAEAVSQLSLDWRRERYLELPETPATEWTAVAIREALKRGKPTAAVLMCDCLTDVSDAAGKLGLQLGRDIDVIGFAPPATASGPIFFNFRYFMPRLREIGRRAVDLWLDVVRLDPSNRQDGQERSEKVPMDLVDYRVEGTR